LLPTKDSGVGKLDANDGGVATVFEAVRKETTLAAPSDIPIGETTAGDGGGGVSAIGDAYFDRPGVWTTVFEDDGSVGVPATDRDGLVPKETLCR